jgi:hypothetical protein
MTSPAQAAAAQSSEAQGGSHRPSEAATEKATEASPWRIAAQAGADKQTIYRRWPSKPAVVLDVYASLAPCEVPVSDTDPRAGSHPATAVVLRTVHAHDRRSVLAGLIAEAQRDAHTQQAFR